VISDDFKIQWRTGPSLGGWHLGTVPRAPRPKGAPRYGGDRRKGPLIDRSI